MSAMTGRRMQVDVFVSGQEGYHTYRIPALAATAKGTVLAFCEGRRNSSHDSGQIDLLVKRSRDGGRTWGETQVIATEPNVTCGNPAPVVDRDTGTIWLPFCKNNADGPERMILEGKAPRTVWMTRSDDDGATWARPWEITSSVKLSNWTWYATGPCHGIQLKSGRLVIPCDHNVGVRFTHDDPYCSHVIYSDDHGTTWELGGTPEGADTNECCAVETVDGAIYLNCRNRHGPRGRAVSWSRDGGETFSPIVRDDTLLEPVCQASVLRFTEAGRHGRNRILFSNPSSTERNRLAVRMSYDECRTWPVGRFLHVGPAAYSDLVLTPEMRIGCLFEGGEGPQGPYEYLTFASFDVEWLTRGADSLGAH